MWRDVLTHGAAFLAGVAVTLAVQAWRRFRRDRRRVMGSLFRLALVAVIWLAASMSIWEAALRLHAATRSPADAEFCRGSTSSVVRRADGRSVICPDAIWSSHREPTP